MAREDAFSVVDYSTPIVNIGSTEAPVVACARYLGILHFRSSRSYGVRRFRKRRRTKRYVTEYRY